jgi:hypothetical protein
MENTLIQIYLFVCQIYDTSSDTCFQRLSNNKQPDFTDQELVIIWLFAHFNAKFQKKQMHEFIKNYWLDRFPQLPSYQTFVLRLNQLEPSVQTMGRVLIASLATTTETEIDSIIDSLPVMLAQQGHSYSAKVAREIAAAVFCAAKKTRFHGVRLHFIAGRRSGKLPVPQQIWLCSAAHHDSLAFKQQAINLPATTLFGDMAFADKAIAELLKEQAAEIITPKKKPKGKELTEFEKYHNRLIAKFRQPIESLFNWINEKTGIQKASKVRSTNGLMIHCWGKLVFAFWLLVFNY